MMNNVPKRVNSCCSLFLWGLQLLLQNKGHRWDSLDFIQGEGGGGLSFFLFLFFFFFFNLSLSLLSFLPPSLCPSLFFVFLLFFCLSNHSHFFLPLFLFFPSSHIIKVCLLLILQKYKPCSKISWIWSCQNYVFFNSVKDILESY